MKQETRTQKDISILALDGRFDAYQVAGPKSWIEAVTTAVGGAAPHSPHLIINLAGVNFIDSTALATLVQGMKRARQQGGDLYLSNLQPPVRMVFELTRLDKAFAIFADEQAALKAFGV